MHSKKTKTTKRSILILIITDYIKKIALALFNSDCKQFFRCMNSWQTRLLHQFKLAQQGMNKLQTKGVHAGIVSVRGNFNCLTSLQKMKVQVIKFQGKRFK